MLVKLLIVVTVLFLSPLSVFAGTFLDTFEDGNLDGWREVVPRDREPGSWEIVDGGLHGAILETVKVLLTSLSSIRGVSGSVSRIIRHALTTSLSPVRTFPTAAHLP